MRFEKYYANGNDFVIFESENLDAKFLSELAKKLCDRYLGLGADGLIAIRKTSEKEYEFEWGFYNQDGSSASMCGNGARAAAHFAYKHKIAQKNMKFLTGAGIIEASIFDDDLVEIKLSKKEILQENIKEFGHDFTLLDTGVPHLVTLDGVEFYDDEMAKILREKYDANVNYASVTNGILHVRTYERGVGETLACGTGMSACFLMANKNSLLKNEAKVLPKSKEICYFSLRDGELFFKANVQNTFSALTEF